MRNSDVSRGAGIAGTLLLAVPVLAMILGKGAPDAVDAIVGLFGFVLLAVSAAAVASRWEARSRSRSHRGTDGRVSRTDFPGERSGSARAHARRATPAAS